jgi:Domain of unknown function (DUF4352)
MNRVVPAIEWLVLLPLWRRVTRKTPLQFVLACLTAVLWPVLIVVVAFDGNGEEPAAEGATSVRAAPGAQAEAGNVRVTLHQIANPWTSDDPFKQAPEGTRLVAFEVTIDFLAAEKTHMANPFHFKLIDAADFAYAEILGGPEPVLNAITLSPGQKTRGWIAFEVEAVTPLKQLVYDPDSSTAEAVEFSFQ